jgi:hypothetical protein
MLHPHGYLIGVDPEAPTLERDSITCAHCCAIVFVKPGFGPTVYLELRTHQPPIEHAGAWCGRCQAPVCLRCHADGRCTPWEQQMERMEARDRFRRQIAGLCT